MKKAYDDNLQIKRIIESNKPFFIGRIAGVELQTAYNKLEGNPNEISANMMELELSLIHI